MEWGLQGLVSLRQFRIEGTKDLLETLLNEQLLPATLHTLQISHVWYLKSLDGKGLEHLTSLQKLQISKCESLKFLPKEGFPESLSYLNIWGCPSLKKRYLKKRYERWRSQHLVSFHFTLSNSQLSTLKTKARRVGGE